MRADTRCEIGVRWAWLDVNRIADSTVSPREPEQFAMDAVADAERREFNHPVAQRANSCRELREQAAREGRMRGHDFEEIFCADICEEYLIERLYLRRPRLAIDCRQFAKRFSRVHVAELHVLA